MKNLRLKNISVIDSNNIEAFFTENLIENLSILNVSISSETPNIQDPSVISASVLDNIFKINIQPLTPQAVYTVKFLSTSDIPFISINGDSVLLNDPAANSQIIIGPVETSNVIKNYLKSYLRENIYNTDDETGSFVSKYLDLLSGVLSKALYDIKQVKNENYLSYTITDQQELNHLTLPDYLIMLIK